MENYYLYYLRDPMTNIVFYVGVAKITKYCPLGYRPKSHIKEAINYRDNKKLGKGANLHKIHTIINILKNNKHPAIEIILNGVSEEEILREETIHIKTIGRRDLGTGPLTNLTDGGEGGMNMSVESRRRISESQKGKTSPCKGRILGPYSEERKKNAAEGIRRRNATGIPKKQTTKIRSPISEETREKISKASIGRISTRKGKTYEEFYGVDKAKDLKNKVSRLTPAIKGKTYEEFYGVDKAKDLMAKLKNRKQPTKGKTYEEIYGVEKARELLEKRRLAKLAYWKEKFLNE